MPSAPPTMAAFGPPHGPARLAVSYALAIAGSVAVALGATACSEASDAEAPPGGAAALGAPTDDGAGAASKGSLWRNDAADRELGRDTAFALDAGGRALLVTFDRTRGELLARSTPAPVADDWAAPVAAQWTLADADALGSGARPAPALVSDPSHPSVHAVWTTSDGLRYAVVDVAAGALLVGPEPFAQGHAPGAPSLAVDPDGTVTVAYQHGTERGLRVATRTPGPGGPWTVEAVSSCAGEGDCPRAGLEDAGSHVAVARVGGTTHVAFYDRLRGDLKLATRAVGATATWGVQTVDGRDPTTGLDTGDVGRFVTMAVDQKLRLGVAYHDASRGNLRFWMPAGDSPDPVVVDDGLYADAVTGALRTAVVGQHVGMRFDGTGTAWLVYFDATHGQLRRARVTDGGVEAATALEGLEGGGWIDLAAATDADGRVRLLGAYGALQPGAAMATRIAGFLLEGDDAVALTAPQATP